MLKRTPLFLAGDFDRKSILMPSSRPASGTVGSVRLSIVPSRKETTTKETPQRTSEPGGEPAFAAALHQLDVEHRRLRTAFADHLGLAHNEYDAFIHIAEAGATTPKELSATLRFTTGATTAMIDRLENMDLVRRTPNPVDRRSVLLEPTPHGSTEAAWVIENYIRLAEVAISTHDTLTAQQLTDSISHVTTIIAKTTTKISERS